MLTFFRRLKKKARPLLAGAVLLTIVHGALGGNLPQMSTTVSTSNATIMDTISAVEGLFSAKTVEAAEDWSGSLANPVVVPCHPPFPHPKGTTYTIIWADACSTPQTFNSPRMRTDLVQADGTTAFKEWGAVALRRLTADSPTGWDIAGQNESIMFQSGGWGYIYGGSQIGGPQGDKYIPWISPGSTANITCAVINPTGPELLEAGLVTLFQQPPAVQPPACCQPAPSCCVAPVVTPNPPQPPAGATLTPAQVQAWCSGNCPISRFTQLVESNGYVNPLGVKMAGGSVVTLYLPSGVSADTPNGHIIGPATFTVNEASVRLN